jgi:hypothetical protein
MISKGRAEITNTPLLSTHRGTQPDLVLHWNEMSAQPASVDVVIHLHGYSDKEGWDAMSLPGEKEPISGLDFFDPDQPVISSGRTRPTLCILPRGNWVKKRQYDFPALTTSDGLSRLIDFSLEYFGTRIGVTGLRRSRFLLTAHSGGGKALVSVLSHVDPDELHVFDALYWSAEHLVAWARRHIEADVATIKAGGSPNGALRVFYLPGMGTEDQSLAVHSKIAPDISAHPSQGHLLSGFYRVERTTVAHLQIPRRLGWQLLRSGGADIAEAISPPSLRHPHLHKKSL